MATADAQRYLQERGLPVTQANLNRVGQLMAANQIAESGENTQDARMQAADTVSRLLGEFEQRSSGTRQRRDTQPTVSVPGTGTDSTMPRSMGAPNVGSSPSPRDAPSTPASQAAASAPTGQSPAEYDMDLASGVAAAVLSGLAARYLYNGNAAATPTTPAPTAGTPIITTMPTARAPAPQASAMGQTYAPLQGQVGVPSGAGQTMRGLPGITSIAPGTGAVTMPGNVVSNSGAPAETMLRAPQAGTPQANPAIQELAARDLSNTPGRGAGGRIQASPRGQVARGTAPVTAPASNVRPGVRGDMNSMIQNGLAPIEMMGGSGPKLLMGLPRRQMDPLY